MTESAELNELRYQFLLWKQVATYLPNNINTATKKELTDAAKAISNLADKAIVDLNNKFEKKAFF